MGACGSNLTPEQREAIEKRSRALDKRMSSDNVAEEEKIKLLLLGAGESGKSTIFKQMRIMYGDEMKERKENVCINSSIQLLFNGTSRSMCTRCQGCH